MPRSTQNSGRPSAKPSTGISRRTVARRAGCAMALPWLESLQARAETTAAAAFPKRFGVVLLGNGINVDHWSAVGSGAAMQGIDPGQTGSLLSGAHISKGAIIHSGIAWIR